MAPRLSIIIPAYNCADYLGQCLDSIADPGGAGPGGAGPARSRSV